MTGQAAQDELRYLKSASMQLWLLGYELTGKPHLTISSPGPSFFSSCLACGTCKQIHCRSGVPHVNQHNITWLCQKKSSVEKQCKKMFCCGLAETVLVFTKEAFHILTSAGKKGAQSVMPNPLKVAQCASAPGASQHLMHCSLNIPLASYDPRGHCLAAPRLSCACLFV